MTARDDELPPGWSSIAQPEPFRSHMTAALGDGRVLRFVEADDLAPSRLYDAQTDRWQITGPQRTKSVRSRSLVVTEEGWVHISGGMATQKQRIVIDAGPVSACELFDPKTLEWHPMPELPVPMYLHATASTRGRVFTIGGTSLDRTSFVELKTVLSWAPGETEWTRMPDLREAMTGIDACVLADDSIVVWGARGGIARFDHEEWLPLEPIPVNSTIVAIDDGFVVAGDASARAWSFSKGWMPHEKLPSPRDRPALVRFHDGRIAAIGGKQTRTRWVDTSDGGELDIEYRSYRREQRYDVPVSDVLVRSIDGRWRSIPSPALWGRGVHQISDGRVVVLDLQRSVIWTPPT